jgi:hypothetical protein
LSGFSPAIVKELVVQCGGSIALEKPTHGGSGLRVVVDL